MYLRFIYIYKIYLDIIKKIIISIYNITYLCIYLKIINIAYNNL